MNTRKRIGTALGVTGLVVAIATVVVWFRLVDLVAIPADRALIVLAFLLAPALAVAAFVAGTRWYGGIAAVLGAGVGLFLLAMFAISPQQVADNPIKVGDTLPYFAATDDKGNRFTSDALAGTPVLIKFFRAHW